MPVTKTELKKLKSLLTSKGRKAHHLFLAEGIRLLEESIRFRFWPTRVYYAPAMLPARGIKLVRQFENKGVKTKVLSTRELKSVSDTETPQGLIGLFEMPTKDLNELSQPHHRKLLLCEEISDPGNLGTLVRSALAFGFDAVLLIGHTAEPYAPKVARASAGAIFGLRVCEISLMDLDDLVGRHHMVVIASDLSGAAELETVRKTIKRRKILLAVGSEATGLSKAVLDRADVRVRIRHSEKVESLNAAVAGSILMKEVHDIIH